jgi:hypothetical protein
VPDYIKENVNDDDSDLAWAPATNVVESVDFKTEDLVRGLMRNLCMFMVKIREKYCVIVQGSIVEDHHFC